MTDQRDNAKLERLAREAAAVKRRQRRRRLSASKLPAELARALASLSAAKEASSASREKHRAAVLAARREVDNIRRRIETAARSGHLPAGETEAEPDGGARPRAEIWEEDGALLAATAAPSPGFPKAARALGAAWNGSRWRFPPGAAAAGRRLARRHYAVDER